MTWQAGTELCRRDSWNGREGFGNPDNLETVNFLRQRLRLGHLYSPSSWLLGTAEYTMAYMKKRLHAEVTDVMWKKQLAFSRRKNDRAGGCRLSLCDSGKNYVPFSLLSAKDL